MLILTGKIPEITVEREPYFCVLNSHIAQTSPIEHFWLAKEFFVVVVFLFFCFFFKSSLKDSEHDLRKYSAGKAFRKH